MTLDARGGLPEQGSRQPSRWRWFWVAVTALPVALVTLPASTVREASAFAACLICGETGAADALRNVLLFVPFGVALVSSGVSVQRAALLGALFSALVELAQLYIAGRDSSFGDVLFNAAGAATGAAAFATRRRWQGRSLTTSWIATSGVAATIVVTAILVRPALPSTTYFGQWAPRAGHLEWYRAGIRGVTIGDRAIPSRPLGESGEVRRLINAGAPIRVRAIAGPPVSRVGALVRVVDAQQDEILLIGPHGNDLLFQYRSVANRMRLEGASFRIPNAFAGVSPGDSLAVSVARDARGYCLSLNTATHCPAALSTGSGWTALMFQRFVRAPVDRMFDMLWLATLFALVGFWTPNPRTLAAQTATLVAVLVGTALASVFVSTSLPELVAAAVGIALGAFSRPLTPRAKGPVQQPAQTGLSGPQGPNRASEQPGTGIARCRCVASAHALASVLET